MSIVTWNQKDYDYRPEVTDDQIWEPGALEPGPFDDGPDPQSTSIDEAQSFIEKLLKQAHLRFYRRRYDQALAVYRQSQVFLNEYVLVNPIAGQPQTEADWLRERLFIRIPMVLGDTLARKGSYMEAAKAYILASRFPGASPPITWGMIWTRAAESIVEAGDRDYRTGEPTAARLKYEMLFDRNSGLFAGSLEGLFVQIEKIRQDLQTTDPTDSDTGDFDGHTPLMRAVVARSHIRLSQLENEEDYFGLSLGYIPITRFDRLQEVARAFAQTAARSNREYVSFKSSAEDQSYSVENLRRSAEVERNGISVELANYESAVAEYYATRESVASARERLRLARAAYRDYDDRGWRIALLEELAAWASSAQGKPRTNLGIVGFEQLGLQGGYIHAPHRIQEIARERARTSFYLRRDELLRQISARQTEVETAEAQRNAAQARRNAASVRVQAARARHAAAQASYEALRERETSARLYFELAEEARRSARISLERAIHVAHLMQKAYASEYGVAIDRIRGDYGDVDTTKGLYAADHLLQEIDYFDYHQAVLIKDKQQNGVHSISLKRDFPIELRKLIQTGEAEFALSLEAIQSRYPGIYNARIKKVLVEFDGYVAEHRPIGSITCGSESSYRLFDASSGAFNTKSRAHGSETQILSDYRLAQDSFVQPAVRDQIAVFENLGLDVSWHIKLPLRLNDFSRTPLYDVIVVVAFSCQHDGLLMVQDVAGLPAESSAVVPFVLSDLVDRETALPTLAKGDPLTFAIAENNIPRFYKQPKIERMQVYLQSGDLPDQLVIEVNRDGQTHGPVEVAEDGRAYLQDPNETPHFEGLSPVSEWTLRIRNSTGAPLEDDWLEEVVFAVQITHSIVSGL